MKGKLLGKVIPYVPETIIRDIQVPIVHLRWENPVPEGL